MSDEQKKVPPPPEVELEEKNKFTLSEDATIKYVKGVLAENASLILAQTDDDQREVLAESFNRAFVRWQREVVDLTKAPRVECVEMDGDTARVTLSLGGHFVEQVVFSQLASSTARHEAAGPEGTTEGDIADFSEFYKSVYPKLEDGEVGGHGFMQWKGTDVCVDLHCTCGHHEHFDGYFLYFYKCHCGKVYALPNHIQLIELNDQQAAFVMKDRPNVMHEAQDERE